MMDQYKIDEYLIRLLNNEISESEFIQLKEWIATDSNAISYYCMFLNDYVIVRRQFESEFDIQDEIFADPEVLSALAQEEKTAPTIEILKEKESRELVQKVIYPPRANRKLSTFNKVILVINAAAILFLVLFLRFAPPKGIEVATLIDSINAKWADTDISTQKGVRLSTNKAPLLLKEGLVEIKFDNNARVTVEGPAEFQILDNDMIKLNYGRLYSQVPSEAFGFQVSTKHARITDLGTEFGVKEGIGGDIEVHVLKGQVNLVSGIVNKKINIDLLDNSARRLNTETGELIEIPCNYNLFARQIDSKRNVIWRGQETLDLADIVGGGNGLGTGEIGKGVSLTNGSRVSDFNWASRKGKGEYLKVNELPFVDGVIVPDSEDGTLQVSSEGHIFRDCPNTSGLYYDEIRNGGLIRMTDSQSSVPMLFDNEQYGTSERPLLFMNSNACITFDLDAIRDSLPGIDISSFRSRCVLFARPNKTKVKKTDIFVLVDGETKFKKLGFDQSGLLLEIDIPLTKSDRFLTLAVADGGDNIAIDWVGFAEPYVFLEADR